MTIETVDILHQRQAKRASLRTITPQDSHSLPKEPRDSKRVEDLKLTLKAITNLRDWEAKTKATHRASEWRVEQMNITKAEKSMEENRRLAPTASYSKTMQELLKLHNAERDKWKSDREAWKLEKDRWTLTYKRQKDWKLTFKRLQDEACAREQQLRKLTVEAQQWKAEVKRLESTKLASADAQEKKTAEVLRDLLGQMHLERQKGKYNKPDVEDWVSQQHAMQLILKKQGWESVQLETAVSDGEKLEEVCRDLLTQLEQRNTEIKGYKVELMTASKWHSLAQQQIREQRQEIEKLKRNQVPECIICTSEFGEDPDQQRAYWKDCHHANICYKCTKTLWRLKKMQCPTCKTPASCMPTRLPPKIYF